MPIGEKIRTLRVSRGLTQKQLVKGLYERSYISLIERGKIKPTTEALSLIASRLGVSMEELAARDQETFDHSLLLYKQGIETQDVSNLERAWKGFFQCGSLNNMVSCVKKWASLVSNSEVLTALKTTLRRAQGTDINTYIKCELRVLMGNCYFNMSMLKNAVWEYEDILSDYPPESFLSRIHVNLGSAMMELADYNSAVTSFQNALKYDTEPRRAMRAYLGLGRCYRYLAHSDKALEYFKQVNCWAKEHDEDLFYLSHHSIGVVLLDQGNVSEGISYLTKVWSYYKMKHLSLHEAEVVEEFIRADTYFKDYTRALSWCEYGLLLLGEQNKHLSGRILLWKSQIYKTLGNDETAKNLESAAKVVLNGDFHTHQKYLNAFTLI